jgi:hypothetical protein
MNDGQSQVGKGTCDVPIIVAGTHCTKLELEAVVVLGVTHLRLLCGLVDGLFELGHGHVCRLYWRRGRWWRRILCLRLACSEPCSSWVGGGSHVAKEERRKRRIRESAQRDGRCGIAVGNKSVFPLSSISLMNINNQEYYSFFSDFYAYVIWLSSFLCGRTAPII